MHIFACKHPAKDINFKPKFIIEEFQGIDCAFDYKVDGVRFVTKSVDDNIVPERLNCSKDPGLRSAIPEANCLVFDDPEMQRRLESLVKERILAAE